MVCCNDSMTDLSISSRESTPDVPAPDTLAPVKAVAFWRIPAIAAGLCLLVTMILIAIAETRGTDVSSLLRDPAVEFEVPVHAGSLSFIGISLLFLTSGATALAARVGRFGRGTHAGASALSLVMALDDQLMLHERVLDDWVGIPEELTLAAYAIAGLWLFAAVSLGQLKRFRAALLVPGGLLAFSVLADVLGASHVVEDVAKIASFAAWSAFWFAVSAVVCTPEPGPEDDAASAPA